MKNRDIQILFFLIAYSSFTYFSYVKLSNTPLFFQIQKSNFLWGGHVHITFTSDNYFLVLSNIIYSAPMAFKKSLSVFSGSSFSFTSFMHFLGM